MLRNISHDCGTNKTKKTQKHSKKLTSLQQKLDLNSPGVKVISTPYITRVTRRISRTVEASVSRSVRLRHEHVITPRLRYLYSICLEIS